MPKYSQARNPLTGKTETAMFLDQYFGTHKHGLKFPGGRVWPEEKCHRRVCATIQAGNTDDKLSQKLWSSLIDELEWAVQVGTAHFSGGSSGDAPWQNWCCVVETDECNLSILRRDIQDIARNYEQDSIAFIVGEVEFLK